MSQLTEFRSDSNPDNSSTNPPSSTHGSRHDEKLDDVSAETTIEAFREDLEVSLDERCDLEVQR